MKKLSKHLQYIAIMDFRLSIKSNNYIRLLRQSSIYSCDNERYPAALMYIFSDISNIQKLNTISCLFRGMGLEWQFNEEVADIQKILNRGLDVVQLLAGGYYSRKNAKKLTISKHTVDTHRRRMLKKINLKKQNRAN